MSSSKKPRTKALEGLKSLRNLPRPTGEDIPGDTFPFGILRRRGPDGKHVPRRTDDRSIAVMAVTALEQALESALLALLPGIKDGNEDYVLGDGGPLSGLDAKVRMAFALGLIGDGARSDLSLLRHIRNTFAHSRALLSFDTPQIDEACRHFTVVQRAPTYFKPVEEEARELFLQVIWAYSIRLITFDPKDSIRALDAVILDVPPSPETPT